MNWNKQRFIDEIQQIIIFKKTDLMNQTNTDWFLHNNYCYKIDIINNNEFVIIKRNWLNDEEYDKILLLIGTKKRKPLFTEEIICNYDLLKLTNLSNLSNLSVLRNEEKEKLYRNYYFFRYA